MRDASTIRGETRRVPGAAGLGCRVEVLDWSLPAAAAFNFRRLPMRGRALAAAIWASAHAGGRSFRKPRADGLSWQNLPEPTSMSLSAQKLGISVRFIRHCAMHKKSGGRAIRTGRVDWRRTQRFGTGRWLPDHGQTCRARSSCGIPDDAPTDRRLPDMNDALTDVAEANAERCLSQAAVAKPREIEIRASALVELHITRK